MQTMEKDQSQDLKTAADLINQEIASRDADAFCEYVIKDNDGKKIIQAQIHREMNEHVDECRKRGLLRCGILAPWGHGKTEQIIISRALQFLGENPNNRIQIVTNTDSNSISRVDSISRYIQDDADFQKVFPSVVPGTKEDWSKHKLIVKRDSKSKDGSVEAWGITTSGTGSRSDFLLVDDPVDLRNAITNPAMRKQVKDAFYNVWSSRLEPNGFVVYIATRWHEDDLTGELLKNKKYSFLVMKVSEDFSCIECESPFKGKYKIPLWDKWSKEALISKAAEIGNRAFDRGYRQRALSDEDRTFPSYQKVFKTGMAACRRHGSIRTASRYIYTGNRTARHEIPDRRKARQVGTDQINQRTYKCIQATPTSAYLRRKQRSPGGHYSMGPGKRRTLNAHRAIHYRKAEGRSGHGSSWNGSRILQ